MLEFDVRDDSTLDAAVADAGVMMRCALRGITQQREFRYIGGSSVRIVEFGDCAGNGEPVGS